MEKGTVTFVDPESGLFGGLGHGICDSDTGEVVEMQNGVATGAILGGVHKGECGKLVGAVTHVMVANPTEGYGIFIENMLNAAQDQVEPKAA